MKEEKGLDLSKIRFRSFLFNIKDFYNIHIEIKVDFVTIKVYTFG